MTALPLGMTDAQSYRVIVEAVRDLSGHQVISLEQAWTALTGLPAVDLDWEERRFVRWMLTELGYEQRWVAEVARRPMQYLWVRDMWQPRDFNANVERPVTCYIPM